MKVMEKDNIVKKIVEFDDKSLLIVDDDNPLRDRLARAMEKKGFQVYQADGARKGIESVKFKKPSFGKKDSAPKIAASGKSNFKQKIENLLKAKLGKKSAQGEEIVGVELSNKEIRLAQIASNKANQWVLENFFVHKVDLPEDAAVLDNADKLKFDDDIRNNRDHLNSLKNKNSSEWREYATQCMIEILDNKK